MKKFQDLKIGDPLYLVYCDAELVKLEVYDISFDLVFMTIITPIHQFKVRRQDTFHITDCFNLYVSKDDAISELEGMRNDAMAFIIKCEDSLFSLK